MTGINQDDDSSKRMTTVCSLILFVGLITVFSIRTEGSDMSEKSYATLPTIGGTAVIQKAVHYNPLLYRIIECESGWNPNAFNRSSGATGLGQFIPSTQAYVQKKWNMELDFWDYEDNLYATKRLLEEETCRHWYPSASCHGCYK